MRLNDTQWRNTGEIETPWGRLGFVSASPAYTGCKGWDCSLACWESLRMWKKRKCAAKLRVTERECESVWEKVVSACLRESSCVCV